MKKFTIFFLMLFMYLGNQVRCESVTLSATSDNYTKSFVSTLSANPRGYAALNTSGTLALTTSEKVATNVPRPKGVKSANVYIDGPHYGCAGDTVTFTAHVIDADPTDTMAYGFTWIRMPDNTPFPASIHAPIPNSAESYRFRVAVNDLCPVGTDTAWLTVQLGRQGTATCLPRFSPEYMFVKLNANTPTLTATEDNCVNALLTASFTSNLNGTSVVEYKWYKGGTFYASTTEPTLVVTIPDDYSVQVVYQLGDGVCVTPKSTDLTVKIGGTPTLTVNPNPVCVGANVELTPNFTGLTAPLTWYDNNAPMFVTNHTNVVSVPVTTVGTHVYSFENERGCAANVTVTALDVPNVYIMGNPLICEGGNVNLTAVTDFTGTVAYQWYEDGVAITGATAATYTATIATNTVLSYVVKITADGVCPVMSDPFVVYVGDEINVGITTPATEVCEHADVILTANVGNTNTENIIYKWFENGVEIAGSNTREYTIHNITTTTAYSVQVINTITGCTKTSTDVTIEVKTPNLITVTVDKNEVCSGTQVQVSSSSTDGTFVWYKNGVEIAGAHTAVLYDEPTTSYPAGSNEAIQYIYKAVQTDVYGCVANNETTVTVFAQPTVVISGNEMVCDNKTAVLTANVNGHNPATTFQWKENGVAQATTTATHTTGALANSNSPYLYTVETGTNTQGCYAISPVFSVEVKPALTVAINATDDKVCVNGEVTLTAMLNYNNANGISYKWYENSMLMAETTRSITVTNNAAGNVIYKVEVTQAGSDCTAENTITIEYNSLPAITAVTATPATVCNGAPVTVTATTTGGIAGEDLTYTWYRNGIQLAGFTTNTFVDYPAISGNVAEPFTYTCTVSQPSAGCTVSNNTGASVEVRPLPTIAITGEQYICEGELIELAAHAAWITTPMYTAADVKWYVDNLEQPTTYHSVTAPTTNYTELSTRPARNYPYIFTTQLDLGNGCVVTSEPYEVYVKQAPQVAVTTTDATICVGGTTTLQAHVDNYNLDNLTFQWSTDGGVTFIPGANELFYTPDAITATTTYTLVVTQTTTECSATANITIVPNTVAAITKIEASESEICQGAQVTVTATTTGGIATEPYTYTWYRNGIELAGITTNSFIDNPTLDDDATGIFVYTATVSQPSSACTTIANKFDTVTVYYQPNVQISGDALICNGGSTTLTANVNNSAFSSAISNYQWRMNNANIAGANSDSYTASTLVPQDEPYIFTVEVTGATGCRAISEPYAVYVNNNITVAVTSSVDSVCANGEVTLTANLGDYNAENLTYKWYTTNGGTETEIFGATSRTWVVYPTATERTYLVRVLQTTTGCSAEGRDTIKVVNPVTDIALTLIPNNRICDGGELTISAAVPTSGTYQWYRNGVQLEGAITNTLTETPTTVDGDTVRYTYQFAYIPMVSGCAVVTVDTAITVYPNPAIAITGDPIICNNTNVQLTANLSNTMDGATYTYQWMENEVDIVGATNATLNKAYASSDNPYNFKVKVTNNIVGCTVVSEPYMVYVNDNASIAAVITATDLVVCAGGEVTLTANIADNNATNLTYTWSKNGTVIDGATQVTYTTIVDATANYTVVIQQTNSGCSANGAITISTTTMPTIALKVNATTDVTICDGGQVTLTAAPTVVNPAVGELTYHWFHNGQEIAGVNGATYTVSPLLVDNDVTVHTYTVMATAELTGCQSAISNTATVTVQPHPAIYLVSNDNTYCDGADVMLNVVYNSEQAPDVYSTKLYSNGAESYAPFIGWISTGMTEYQGAFTDNVVVPTDANNPYQLVYQVEVAFTNGCTVRTNELPVYVAKPFNGALTLAENTICENGNVVATFEMETADVVAIYDWKINSTFLPTAFGNQLTTDQALVVGANTINVEVTDAIYGCKQTYNQSLEVVEKPVVEKIIFSADTVCEGFDLLVTAVLEAGHGVNNVPYTYTWYKNGALMEGYTAAQFHDVVTLDDNNNAVNVYSVVASQANSGCTSALVTDSVLVVPNPTIHISGDQLICDGSHIKLNAHINDNNIADIAYTYRWRLFNADITTDAGLGTANTDSLIVSKPASDQPYQFTVVVDNGRGCAVTSEPYNVYVNDSIFVEVTSTVDSLCAGGEVTFTANLIDYNDVNLTYRWSESTDGVAYTPIYGATQRELTVNPTHAGFNYYKVDILQTTSACAAVGVDSVKVITSEQIEFVSVSNNTICNGGEMTIKVTHYETGFYTWYKNGQRIPGVNLDTYTDSPALVDGDSTAYRYAVIYTPNVEGCVSDMIDTLIQVFPNPTVQITGDAIVCTQTANNINLTAYISDTTIASDNLTYEWRLYNNIILNETNATLTQSQTFQDHPYIYTVQVSNDKGCTAISEPYEVYVNDNIIVEVTASADSVCAGAEVTLTAHLGNYNTEDLVYEWRKTVGGVTTAIFGAREREITVIVDETATYEATVTQTTSQCKAKGDTLVTVFTPADIKINLVHGNDTICSGGQIELTVTKQNGDALTGGHFVWTRNGVIIEGATGAAIIESPLAVDDDTTNYLYGVTYFPDYVGCSVEANDTLIKVYGNPSVQISGDPIICNFDTTTYNVILVANVNDSFPNNFDYQWRLANQDITGAPFTGYNTNTLKAHQLAASDNPYLFTVMITNAWGCNTLSEEFPVYVNDTAAIQVEITTDADSVCKTGEVTFTAHIADYNSSNLIYQWFIYEKAVDGVTDTLVEIPYATEPVLTYEMEEGGMNRFALRITQTTSGCVAWGFDSVYVWDQIPYKIVDIVAKNPRTGVTQICDGGEVEVAVSIARYDNTPIDSTRFTYEWRRNGFEHPFLDGPWFRESPLTVDDDTTDYIWSAKIVLDIPGCKYSELDYSNVVTVTRNPIVVIQGNPYVCEHDVVALNAWVNGRQGLPATTTYNWYVDGRYRPQVGNSWRWYYEEANIPVTTDWNHEVIVEVIDGNGCSAISDPFQVVVYEAPVTHIVATEDSICQGGEVTLTATLENNNLHNLRYVWYANSAIESNRILGAHEATYTVSPAATTYYIVHVYSNQGGNNEPLCTAKDTMLITVVDDPKVDSVVITENQVCDGGQVTITAHATGGVASDEYFFTWYRNNELIDGVTDSVFTESPLTIDGDITKYVYSAQVSQVSSGCLSVRTFATDTLTVYPNPTVVIAGDPIICEDSVIRLSANVTNQYMGSDLTYTWLLYNDTIRQTTTTQDTIRDVRGPQDYPYIYTVVVNNPNGCRTESAPYYVYVNDTIIVEVTATETNICEGGEVTLTANLGDYNDSDLTYRWYSIQGIDTAEISGATQATYTTTVDITTKFRVRVFQTPSACLSYGEYTINVFDDPQIDTINLSVYEICDGGQVTVTAHASKGVNSDSIPYIFTWYRNNELMEGYTDSTFTVSDLTVDGDITDYVFSATVHQTTAGCMSVRSYADTLRVNPNPTVVIRHDPVICQDSIIKLTAFVTDNYADANLTYTWKLDNDTIHTDMYGAPADKDTLSLSYPTRDHAYNFTVVVANEHGCTSESEVVSVEVKPRVVVEITASEDTICEGGTTILTANIDNYNLNDLMYSWSDNNSTPALHIDGALQRVITVEPNRPNTTYYLDIYQVGSECHSYDTITIQVNEVPQIDTIELSVNEICDGGQVTVTAHASKGVNPATHPYIFTWYRNNELMEGYTDSTLTVSDLTVDGDITDYVFSATVHQDASGCASARQYAELLRVNPNPTVVISYDPHICQDSILLLTANVTNQYDTAELSYTWLLDNDTIAYHSAGNVSAWQDTLVQLRAPRDHSYNYTVVVANEHGCTTESAVANVFVHPRVVVEISASEDTTICQGGSTNLIANIDNYNLDDLMYRWTKNSLNGDTLAGAMQRVITVSPADTTMYYVTVYQVGSECRSFDSLTINVNKIPVIDTVKLSFYEMCFGGQPTVTAYAHGGVDSIQHPYIYTWYRNGELIEGVTGASFTDNFVQMAVDDDDTYYIYTAVVHQEVSGCVSEPKSADRLNVYMNPRVQVTGDPYVCETDPVSAYANVDTTSISVGTLHFTWYESGQIRDNMAYGLGDARYYSEYFPARPNPYLLQVEVTRGNGCRTMSEPFEVYVQEKPIVSVTANETDICVGGSVTLTANLENYHHEDLTFQWYKESISYANQIYGATQPTYTTSALDTTTTFFVKVIRSFYSECWDVDNITINVHPDPIIDTIEISDADTVICAGGEFTLTARTTVDAGLGTATYTWFRNGIEIVGATDSVLTEHPFTVDNDSVHYTYTVLVTMSASGCQSVIDEKSTQRITVLPNATVRIEGDPVICGAGDELDTIRLIANVNDTSALVDGFTYEWRLFNRTLQSTDAANYDNINYISGVDSNVLLVAVASSENPYIFTVVIGNENGCSVYSEEFPVFVNDTTSIVVTASETDICRGGEVTLFANLGDYNVPNLTYQWYILNADGTIDTIAGATSSTYTTTLDSTTVFSVDLVQTTSSCLSVNTITVNVYEDPTVALAISDNDTNICEGGQFTLTATTYLDATLTTMVNNDTTVLGGFTYTWFRNGVEIEYAHGNSITESPVTVDNDSTAYTYQVIVTLDASGCQSVITDSSTIRVMVHRNPTIEIVGDHFICGAGQGVDSVHLLARVNDTIMNGDSYNYEWRLFNQTVGTNSANMDTLLLPNDEPYIFTAIIRNENGCTTTSETFELMVAQPVVVSAHTTEADICEGGVVTVSANLDNYNIEGLTYQWYSIEGNVTEHSTVLDTNLMDNHAIDGATSSTYTTMLDTTTTFFVVVRQPNSSCMSADSVVVRVHEDPIIDSVTVSDLDTNICEGGQFTLTAHVKPYDAALGAPVYTWYRNGVMIENATSNTITESPVTVDGDLTNYTYQVLVTLAASGCQSTIDTNSTVNIHVYPNSTVRIEGDPIICGAGLNTIPTILTAHLNDTVVDADGYTYEWRLFNRTIDATDTNVNNNSYNTAVLNYDLAVSDNPYIFQVIVHNENGCTNVSEDFYVYVNDTAHIVVTVNESDICEGGQVTFTANIGDYNMPNLTYQWYQVTATDSVAVAGATQSTYTTAFDAVGTYTYQVKVYQPTSNCVAYGQESVTVHADPTVSVAISDEDTTICEGGQFTLTATAYYDTELGEPVYTWFRNGVEVVNAEGNVLTDSPVTVDGDITEYTYEVIVTLAQSGCQSIVTDSSTMKVTVYANPTVEIEGDHNICGAGMGADTVKLVANVNDTSAYVDGFTYEWRLFNRTIEGATEPTFDTVLPSNDEPYLFTIIVKNENGCTIESAPFDVTIHEPVVVTALTTEADICVGGEVTVSAHLDNYNVEGLTYQWVIGADSIFGATEATYTSTLDSTTTFGVYVSQPTTSCISYAEVTVNVHDDPTVTLAISDEDTVICDGGQFTLTATAVYDDVLGEAVYTWTRNGEELVDVHTATLTESPVSIDNDITTYTYTVYATLTASGCQSVVTDSSTITVTVRPNPTVVIAGDPVICGNGANATSVQLTAVVNDHSDLVDGFSYEWRLFNNTLGFNTNVLDTVLAPSENPYIFTAIVWNENGCSMFSETYSVTVNAAPVVNAEAVEADYCVGGTTTLISHIIDRNADNLTYQWLHEGDTIHGANEETYVTPANLREGTHTYTVLVYQTNSDCIASADVVINVHADPIINNITVSNDVICDGGQVVVTANATLAAELGEVTYTWYKNGTELVGVTSNTFIDYPTIVDDQTTVTYSAIVTLRASGCTSAEVAAPVVTINRHATVSVVANGSLTVCEGGFVTLNANVDPAGTYTYRWFLDNQPVGHDTNVYYVQGLAARETPYMVYVEVESNPGCITTTMNEAVAINFVAAPVVTLVDANNNSEATVCVGGTATLTASYEGGVSQINGLGVPTYTWYNNGTEVGTGNTYAIPTDLTEGIYTYTVVMSFADSTYGCDVNSAVQGTTGIYTFNVVADPTPVIAIHVDNDATVCEGGSTQLYVHHIDGGIEGADYQYQWFRNGIMLAGETNPTLTTDATLPVADYTYQVVVSAAGLACEGASNTIIVPVVAAPVVAVTGASNVCVGGQITLTADVDNTYGAAVTYQWNRVENGHAQVIAGATESTYTTDSLLALGSYSYSVTVTNPISGCTVTSGVVTANVVADPTVVIVNAADVCEGGVVTMNAVVTETVDGASYTYTWYRNDQVVGSNSTSYTTDATLTAGNYVYRVEITPADQMGCNAISAPVNANVIPVATVTIAGHNAVCEGGSVELTANVYPVLTGNSYNYAWYRDGIALATNAATINTDATLAEGTYTYSVEVWNASYDIDCKATATFTYTVVADPTIDSITSSLPNNQLCLDGTVTLTAYMSSAFAATNTDVHYVWTVDGRTMAANTTNNITFTPDHVGTIAVSVYAIVNHNEFTSGCQSAVETTTIEVVAQPYVGINYSGLLQVCEGGSVELNAVIEGGVGTPSIVWRRNNAQVSAYNNLTTIYTDVNDQIGSYRYAVNVNYPAATGCRATSDEVTVEVLYQPRWTEAVVTTANSNPDICEGERVTLVARIEGGVVDANSNTGSFIQWVYAPINDLNDVTNVSCGLGGVSCDFASTPGTYVYFPTYIAPAGSNCAPSNTPNLSGNIITVHAHPTVVMGIGAGTDVICANNDNSMSTIYFTFTGTAPFSFELQDMTTMEITSHTTYSNQYSIQVNPDRTTTYQIFNLSDRYCDGEVVATNTVTVTVSNFVIAIDSVAICPDTDNPVATFTFINNTVNDTRDTVWFEIIDYNNIGFDYSAGMVDLTNNTVSVYLPTNEPGTYRFAIRIDDCEYDVVAQILWGNLNAIQLIDQKWDDVVVCNNNPATNGGHTFVSYQWYKDGQIIPGATEQYYQQEGGLNGFYSLYVIDDQGNEYMTCELMVATSVQLRIYPVPANVGVELTIELPFTEEEFDGAYLNIYDAKGALVKQVTNLQTITRIAGFDAQGTYFGRIVTGTNHVKTVKFIIVK